MRKIGIGCLCVVNVIAGSPKYVSFNAGLGLMHPLLLYSDYVSTLFSAWGGLSYMSRVLDVHCGVSFFFSRNVREDPLKSYRSSSGFILSEDGLPADLYSEERGWLVHLTLSRRLYPFRKQEKIAFLFSLGTGWIWRGYRFKSKAGNVPWLNDKLVRGYLGGASRGPALIVSLGIRNEDFVRFLTFGVSAGALISPQHWSYNFGGDSAIDLPWRDRWWLVAAHVSVYWFIVLWREKSAEELYWE